MGGAKWEEIIKNNQIIIYGCGNSGVILYERMKQEEIEVLAFIDNAGSIYGKSYDTVPVYTNDEMLGHLEKEKNYIVIVALLDIVSYEMIKHEINVKLNVFNNLQCFFFSQLRTFNRIFGLDKQPRFSAYLGENNSVLIENKERIIHVYDLLADQLSKRCFLELLNYYITSEFYSFTISPFHELYFAYDLYEKIENEVFVDCGAYDGDTLDNFIKNQNGQYKKYIAIEADRINCAKLKKRIELRNLDNIKIMQSFVSDDYKEIYFTNRGTSYSKREQSEKSELVQAVPLDELVYQDMPTYIKICIEGADTEAIIGAEKTIKKYSPIMAVQGHHNVDHLWRIVEILEEFNGTNYRFFLRNYMGITQFVFYAIPLQRVKINL